MILTQSYFLLTEGWRMFLPEGPLVDTTNRERLQLITRENGKSLSKSNQHVRKAHYRGFLLLNVNNVNEILLINKVTLRLAILTISKLTGENAKTSVSPRSKRPRRRRASRNGCFRRLFQSKNLRNSPSKTENRRFFRLIFFKS